MKALMRGFGFMLVGVIVLGFTGCGSDNESDAAKLQNTGTPPPAPEGSTATSTPKYNSIEDYAKARKQNIYEGTKLDKTTTKTTTKK